MKENKENNIMFDDILGPARPRDDEKPKVEHMTKAEREKMDAFATSASETSIGSSQRVWNTGTNSSKVWNTGSGASAKKGWTTPKKFNGKLGGGGH